MFGDGVDAVFDYALNWLADEFIEVKGFTGWSETNVADESSQLRRRTEVQKVFVADFNWCAALIFLVVHSKDNRNLPPFPALLLRTHPEVLDPSDGQIMEPYACDFTFPCNFNAHALLLRSPKMIQPAPAYISC